MEEMELRSAHRKRNNTEYKELQILLNGLGCYESDMEIQEMRHLITALKASVGYKGGITDGNVSSQPTEIIPKAKEDHNQCEKGRELMENEFIDFQPTSEVHNSTMIIPNTIANHSLSLASSYCSPYEISIALPPNKNLFSSNICLRSSSSPFSSPEMSPKVITIQAEIHHENDWSPPLVSQPPSQFSLLSSLSPPSSSLSPPSWRNCYHSSSISFEKSWGVLVDLEEASKLKYDSIKNDNTYSTTTTADTTTNNIIVSQIASGSITTTSTSNTFVVNDEKCMLLEEVPASSFSSSGSSQRTFILSSLPCATTSASLSVSAPTSSFDSPHSLPAKSNDSGISSIFSNSMKIENFNRSNEKTSFNNQNANSCRFSGNEENNDNNKVN